MISNPFFILSVLISSLLAFFTTAFVIEGFIKIFRIRYYRVRSMLRLIPFFTLIVDLLLNQYSIAHFINPLNCASCLQKLFLEVFFPQLKAYLIGNQVPLINYLGFNHQNDFYSAVFIAFGTLSIILVLNKLIQAFFSMRSFYAIAKRSSIYKYSIKNEKLSLMLQKTKAIIYFTREIKVPVAVYPRIIIIPEKTIENLSKQEFEAVIAHELEHLKYQDSLVRLGSYLVAAFFWWVPMSSWIKKMEQEQEFACDQNVLKYGIQRDSIACALVKAARQSNLNQMVCSFTSAENLTLVRIQEALGFNKRCPILGVSFLAMFFGGVFLVICMMYL